MEMKGFQVEISSYENKEDVYRVCFQGVLDTLTVDNADNQVNPLLEKDKICLILDCRSLSYLNSTGLATILRYHIHLHRRGGALKLISPSRVVAEIIEVSGAIKLLQIYNNESDAYNAWLTDDKTPLES